ncbi:hypothetical protein ACFE6N_05565 [Pedobacter sp. BG31]|uniref:hypothetical protein n=1 Tax=Pedobacter sp. BG31 TaxID=3349697 RepID=UPI0035F2D943
MWRKDNAIFNDKQACCARNIYLSKILFFYFRSNFKNSLAMHKPKTQNNNKISLDIIVGLCAIVTGIFAIIITLYQTRLQKKRCSGVLA